MKQTDNPAKIMLPWATDGNKNTIPLNSQIGVVAGAASWTDGFPPLTMTPLAAGGIPPSGLDMNGVLHDLSAQARWAGAGAGAVFDQTFADAAAVGGYPKGARVLRRDGTGYWISQIDDNTTDPEAGGTSDWLPAEQPGLQLVTITSENVTLTPEQYGRRMIVLTGLATTNLQLFLPNDVPGEWQIINATTGGHSITVKCAAGAGTSLTLNKPSSTGAAVTSVVSDGVNVYTPAPEVEIPSIPDVAIPMAVVNNVAELRMIEPSSNLCVTTRGYWQPGDPGSALYVPVTDPSSNVTDNGGTIVRWNGGNKYWTPVGQRTISTWGVMPQQWESGITGTNNHSRFQVAADNEVELNVPVGIYNFADSVTLRGIGTALISESQGTNYATNGNGTLLNFTSGNLIILAQASGASSNQISSVKINGMKIRGANSAYSVQFSSNGIGELKIDSCLFDSVSFLGRVGFGETACTAYRNTFRNCSFSSAGNTSLYHKMGTGATRSQDNLFISCQFLGGTVGIDYGSADSGGAITTIGCVFGDYTSAGIRTNPKCNFTDIGSSFGKCYCGVIFTGTFATGASRSFNSSVFRENSSYDIALALQGVPSSSVHWPLTLHNCTLMSSNAIYAAMAGATLPITLNGSSIDSSCIGAGNGAVLSSQISSSIVIPASGGSETTYVAGSGISIVGNVISATGDSGTTVTYNSGVYVKRLAVQAGMNSQNIWTIPNGATLSRYRFINQSGTLSARICWYKNTNTSESIGISSGGAASGVWKDITLSEVAYSGNNVVYVFNTSGSGSFSLDLEYYIPVD